MTSPTPHRASPHRPDFGGVPAMPPADVLQEVQEAWTVYDRLQAADRHLHFDLDAVTGQLTVQLCDLAGHLVDTVSSQRVLAIAAGEIPA